jgi:transaldolase
MKPNIVTRNPSLFNKNGQIRRKLTRSQLDSQKSKIRRRLHYYYCHDNIDLVFPSGIKHIIHDEDLMIF